MSWEKRSFDSSSIILKLKDQSWLIEILLLMRINLGMFFGVKTLMMGLNLARVWGEKSDF